MGGGSADHLRVDAGQEVDRVLNLVIAALRRSLRGAPKALEHIAFGDLFHSWIARKA